MDKSDLKNQGILSDKAINNLLFTANFVIFFTFFFGAFSILFGLFLFNLISEFIKIPLGRNLSTLSLVFGYIPSVCYVLVQLFKISTSFKSFAKGKKTQDLENGFKALKNFWEFSVLIILGSLFAFVFVLFFIFSKY
jgi:hypothetical protein